MARAVICANNLKQQGLAMMEFGGDHNGAVPGPANYPLPLGLGQYIAKEYGSKAIADSPSGLFGGGPDEIRSLPSGASITVGGIRIPRTIGAYDIGYYRMLTYGIVESAYFSMTVPPCKLFLCPDVPRPEGVDSPNVKDLVYEISGWSRFLPYGVPPAIFTLDVLQSPPLVDLCANMKPYRDTVGCAIHNKDLATDPWRYEGTGMSWFTLGRRFLSNGNIVSKTGVRYTPASIYYAADACSYNAFVRSPRHFGKANCLFFDGRVKAVGPPYGPYFPFNDLWNGWRIEDRYQ